MGKLNSGILGPVSGKVAGVVGSRWKGQAYIRAYVVPGASNTTLQTDQRGRFSYVVEAGKPFVGRVFNPYYDKFLSKVSGFNRFVSNNIPKAPAYTPITNFQITDGPLYPGSALTASYVTATGIVSVTWNAGLGVDGANTDIAICSVRNTATNEVTFMTDGERVDAAGTIAIAAGLGDPFLDVSLFFVKMSGTLVSKISRNLSVTATTP